MGVGSGTSLTEEGSEGGGTRGAQGGKGQLAVVFACSARVGGWGRALRGPAGAGGEVRGGAGLLEALLSSGLASPVRLQASAYLPGGMGRYWAHSGCREGGEEGRGRRREAGAGGVRS